MSDVASPLSSLRSGLQQGAPTGAQGAAQPSQAARATELVEALRKVAALEYDLHLARQAAHRLELEQQGNRARALVERESLAAQLEQLRARLDGAEANAAARQQVAELWQRKHAHAETRAGELEAALQEERAGREALGAALQTSQQLALQAQAEAGAFRKATAATLRDLSELCSALQTAQAAMAVDSSSRPEYRSALHLIEASLQRVAGASESAMSAVMASAACLPGPCSSGGSPGRVHGEASPLACLLGPQLQQQVQGLLRQPDREAEAASQQPTSSTVLQAAVELAGVVRVQAEAPAAQEPCGGGGTLACSPYRVPPSAAAAAGASQALATLQLPGVGSAASEQGRAQHMDEQSREPALPDADPEGQPQQHCPPTAPAFEAAGRSGLRSARGRRSPDASSAQQPSAFLQSFRAQHGRRPVSKQARFATDLTPARPASPPVEKEQGTAADSARQLLVSGAAAAPAGKLQPRSSSPPLAAAGRRRPAFPRAQLLQQLLPVRMPARAPAQAVPAPGAGALALAHPPGKLLGGLEAALLPGMGAASTHGSLTAVIMAVEDELATLDLRHAALLQQSRQLADALALPGDTTAELERERVAGVIRSVQEAMQRKGEQLRQLRQYRDAVAAG